MVRKPNSLLLLWQLLLAVLVGLAQSNEAGWNSAQMTQNPLDCLTARTACLSELTCKISFDSLERRCGSADSMCNASKLPHCLSVLKTLENRSPFRNCHCERDFDSLAEEEECERYSRLVLQHPCASAAAVPLVTRRLSPSSTRSPRTNKLQTMKQTSTSTGNPKADQRPADCAHARKQCASDDQCNKLMTAFKQACRKGHCGPSDSQACARVTQQLRNQSALFSCQCNNARFRKHVSDKTERCENVYERFQMHQCVLQSVGSQDKLPLLSNCSLDASSQSQNCSSEVSDADCYDVVTQCDKDVTCRTQLAKLISACKITRTTRSVNNANVSAKKNKNKQIRGTRNTQERCNTLTCQRAASEFFATVDSKLAKQAAFCRCDAHQADYSNCVKHQDYFRPPCLFQADNAPKSVPATRTPVVREKSSSCLNLLDQCLFAAKNEFATCELRWQHLQKHCEASSHGEGKCVRGVQSCRNAMLQLLGLPVFTSSCSCGGLTDKMKTLCLSVQQTVRANECVRQASTVQWPVAAAAARPLLDGPVVSTGYSGLAQERYPRDFCSQVQRYNRLSNTHRIYMFVNGSECSELCNCSSDGKYTCRNLTCASNSSSNSSEPGTRQQLASACSSLADGHVLVSDSSQHCVCQHNEAVCSPLASASPTPQADGLFLHVGYSVNEQRMLQSNQVRLDFQSLINKLTQLLNGQTGVSACDLQLQAARDGGIVFQVSITAHNTTSSPQADEAGRQVCFYPAQLLSHFINTRHPQVSHDAELSVFRSAALQRVPRAARPDVSAQQAFSARPLVDAAPPTVAAYAMLQLLLLAVYSAL